MIAANWLWTLALFALIVVLILALALVWPE